MLMMLMTKQGHGDCVQGFIMRLSDVGLELADLFKESGNSTSMNKCGFYAAKTVFIKS